MSVIHYSRMLTMIEGWAGYNRKNRNREILADNLWKNLI